MRFGAARARKQSDDRSGGAHDGSPRIYSPPSTPRVARGGAELRSDVGIARDLASHGFILGENKRNVGDVSADIFAHVDPSFYYGAAKTAAMTVLEG